MNRALRRSALVAVIASGCVNVSAAATGVAEAAAVVPRTVHVQGSQTQVGVDLFAMRSAPGRAGLVGAWANTSKSAPVIALPWIFETGTERFDGCLDLNGDNHCGDEPAGRLTFTYAAWLKIDITVLPAFKELAGGCVHPVTGGTEAFKGASGLITMTDRPVGDTIETTYRGTVTLASRQSAVAATKPMLAAPEVGAASSDFSAASNAAVTPTSEAAGPPAPAALPRAC